MAKKKQPTKKPRHDYEKLRKAWSLTPGSLSQKEFAEKFKIPVRTLQNRMKRDADNGEPWDRDIGDAVKQTTRRMQQRIAAGLDANTPVSDEALAVATAAATNVLILETHEKAFGKAMDTIIEGLDMLKGQVNQGYIVVENRKRGEIVREDVDISAEYVGRSMNALTSSLDRVVKMQRHHQGLDDAEDDSATYESDLEALASQIEEERDESLENGLAELANEG